MSKTEVKRIYEGAVEKTIFSYRLPHRSPRSSFAVRACTVGLYKPRQHFMPGSNSNSLKVLGIHFFLKGR